MFGGTFKKYILLLVLEGLEVWIQLQNVKNCLTYQFLPFPSTKASGRYTMNEAELNKFDCVPVIEAVAAAEGSSVASRTPY